MKASRQERISMLSFSQHRFRMAAMFSLVVFVVLTLTLLLVGGVLSLLFSSGTIVVSGIEMTTVRGFLLLIGGASIVIGTLATFFVIRLPLAPLTHTIRGLNALARGDYSVRLRSTEFFSKLPSYRALYASFNALAEALQETEKLEADTVNTFSHACKTPVASISGFAKLLKNPSLPKEKQAEYLAVIEEESDRLAFLCTKLLSLSKLEHQSILTDRETYNVSEQIRTCMLALAPEWEKKRQEIDMDFDEYSACLNRELMQEVWTNLLENAVKYAPEGERIWVRLQQNDGALEAEIGNTGSEIPEEARQHLFERFYRAPDAKPRSGHGLGLAIVRQIVTMHGGTVAVGCADNRTVFKVILPSMRE